MSRVEHEDASVPIVNLYLHRLFRISCIESMNRIHPIEVAPDFPKASLIKKGIIANFNSLIDLGYQNEAVQTLKEGVRIQIGTETEKVRAKQN